MLLGPFNGGLPWRAEYPNLRRREKEWLVPVRNAYRLLPYYRATYRHVAGVIAGSRHTATEVPDWFRNEVYKAGGGNSQSLINLALRDFVSRSREPLENTLRRAIREELRRAG